MHVLEMKMHAARSNTPDFALYAAWKIGIPIHHRCGDASVVVTGLLYVTVMNYALSEVIRQIQCSRGSSLR